MAKKITRGITGIKEINKQDFDTNNVNDLLSDGQYNYIHRKKGKSEEYHNLTDNIKTISSDNTDLLTVTNNNKTNNTATLHPKHDAQKEQVLESERNTITINHGTNATTEKTKVDTNPEKVLEHDNLRAGDGLKIHHEHSTSTIKIEPTFKARGTTAKDLENGMVYGIGFSDTPTLDLENTYHYTTIKVADNKNMQIAVKESAITPTLMIAHYRFITNGTPSGWRQMTIDNTELNKLLALKQNTLTSNTSIGVANDNTLRQLFYYKKTYSQTGGTLKTHIKQLSQNTSISEVKNEYNFLLKINQGESSLTFTLESTDSFFFSLILGSSNTANISGCVFTKSGTTLTVSTSNNTDKDYIITFSELMD